VKDAKFLVRHFLQPDTRGWPRAIDVYLDEHSQVWLQPKRNRVNDDGSLGVRSLPALVTPDEIFEAIKSAELYLDQVIKPEVAADEGRKDANGASR
jgi:hypothetical protein